MHPIRLTRRLLLGGLALAAGFHTAQSVSGQQPPMKETAKDPTATSPKVKVGKSGELLVPQGGSVEFKPKLPAGKTVSDKLIANEQVLNYKPSPTDPDAILLVGANPGVTRITFGLNDGSRLEYEVIVQPDFELLKKVIQRAVPTASVEVIPGVGNGIILTGYVNNPADADVIVRIAGGNVGGGGAGAGGGGAGGGGAAGGGGSSIVNAIRVGGPQHVMIEVVVAQVSRSELRIRGTDFFVNGNSGSFSSVLSGLVTAQQSGFNGLQQPQISPDANLRFGLVSPQFFAALRALKSEGLSKILSEPKLVTQSGRPATILSGGRQAVLSATGGGFGAVSVQLERVGTNLDVIPLVYGDGKIFLEVQGSIVQPDAGRGIQTPFGFSTGFAEQSVRTTVVLESGQTYAIGGLLETTVQATSAKLPVLGEIPFVGGAFSTVRHEERESELIILVTPRLVDAMGCDQVPRRVPGRETRSPDDYELFLEGLLEAPRGQRQVWNGKCYNAAYKCDPTYGIFPAKGNVCTGGPAGCAPTATLTYPTQLPAVLPASARATTTEPVPVTPAVATQPVTVPATSNVTPAAAEVPVPVPEQPQTPVVLPSIPNQTVILPPIAEPNK